MSYFQYLKIELKICFPLLCFFCISMPKKDNASRQIRISGSFLTALFILNRCSITFLIALSEVITVMIHNL